MPGTVPALAASITATPASASTEWLEPSNSTNVILGIYSALTLVIHTIAASRILARFFKARYLSRSASSVSGTILNHICDDAGQKRGFWPYNDEPASQ